MRVNPVFFIYNMLLINNKYEKISKYLNLDKPLIIFDCEATGTAISSDRIINLSYIKIFPDGHIKKEDYLFNPEIKISPEATAIHGIRNEHIQDKKKFKEKAQEIWEIFNNCYYSGFNIINFDLLLLRREFIRIGIDFEYDTNNIIDVKKIYERFTPATLRSAYHYYYHKYLKLDHSAMFNTETAANILIKQLDKYKEIRNKEFIHKLHETADDDTITGSTQKFYWVAGEAYFSFSKYKDKPLSWVAKKDPKFLDWILQADFSENTKNIIKNTIKK